jgi:hypothetical protein
MSCGLVRRSGFSDQAALACDVLRRSVQEELPNEAPQTVTPGPSARTRD